MADKKKTFLFEVNLEHEDTALPSVGEKAISMYFERLQESRILEQLRRRKRHECRRDRIKNDRREKFEKYKYYREHPLVRRYTDYAQFNEAEFLLQSPFGDFFTAGTPMEDDDDGFFEQQELGAALSGERHWRHTGGDYQEGYMSDLPGRQQRTDRTAVMEEGYMEGGYSDPQYKSGYQQGVQEQQWVYDEHGYGYAVQGGAQGASGYPGGRAHEGEGYVPSMMGPPQSGDQNLYQYGSYGGYVSPGQYSTGAQTYTDEPGASQGYYQGEAQGTMSQQQGASQGYYQAGPQDNQASWDYMSNGPKPGTSQEPPGDAYGGSPPIAQEPSGRQSMAAETVKAVAAQPENRTLDQGSLAAPATKEVKGKFQIRKKGDRVVGETAGSGARPGNPTVSKLHHSEEKIPTGILSGYEPVATQLQPPSNQTTSLVAPSGDVHTEEKGQGATSGRAGKLKMNVRQKSDRNQGRASGMARGSQERQPGPIVAPNGSPQVSPSHASQASAPPLPATEDMGPALHSAPSITRGSLLGPSPLNVEAQGHPTPSLNDLLFQSLARELGHDQPPQVPAVDSSTDSMISSSAPPATEGPVLVTKKKNKGPQGNENGSSSGNQTRQPSRTSPKAQGNRHRQSQKIGGKSGKARQVEPSVGQPEVTELPSRTSEAATVHLPSPPPSAGQPEASQPDKIVRHGEERGHSNGRPGNKQTGHGFGSPSAPVPTATPSPVSAGQGQHMNLPVSKERRKFAGQR